MEQSTWLGYNKSLQRAALKRQTKQFQKFDGKNNVKIMEIQKNLVIVKIASFRYLLHLML